MERGTGKPRLVLLALVSALAGLVAVPASAGAVLPGPNGRIVFTSGRTLTNATSQIWMLKTPGGAATRLSNEVGADSLHHRHASWSPDRTKIAYASGPSGFAGPWDIWVLDLQLGSRINITAASPGSEDRPVWSPDGTRIAYQKDTGPATNVNIAARLANGSGGETTVAQTVETGTGASAFYPRPSWSSNSQTIFYARFINATNKHDLYRSPANGTNATGTGVITGTNDDYHPQVSPDGTKLCFTRQGANKDIDTALTTGAGVTPLGSGAGDEYECTWSPDMKKIAFVRGAQNAGEILMRNSNATGTITSVTDVANTFDGNPDWAPNPGPTCMNRSFPVAFNAFISIPLTCTDPAPESESTSKAIATSPEHGTLGPVKQGNPATVIYTPNLNFSGNDSFTFTGSDGTSKSAPATISITVAKPGVVIPGNTADKTAPVISGTGVSPARWRRGSALPRFSLAPKGTTIRFSLSEMSVVTLTFAKPAPGRRVGRRCVRPTPSNRTRRRCTRYVFKGTVRAIAKTGANRVRFQGKLSARRQLGLGRHRVTFGAVDSAGNKSTTRAAFFTIVRR
jgi:hypothetical protein